MSTALDRVGDTLAESGAWLRDGAELGNTLAFLSECRKSKFQKTSCILLMTNFECSEQDVYCVRDFSQHQGYAAC